MFSIRRFTEGWSVVAQEAEERDGMDTIRFPCTFAGVEIVRFNAIKRAKVATEIQATRRGNTTDGKVDRNAVKTMTTMPTQRRAFSRP